MQSWGSALSSVRGVLRGIAKQAVATALEHPQLAAGAAGVAIGGSLIIGGMAVGRTTAWRRVRTAAASFFEVCTLSNERIDRFMRSYELFETEAVTPQNVHKIADYYGVLNLMCSMGDVEKMYIPPIVDPNQGIFANQELWELRMALQDIQMKPGDRVLDVGCGRGRIAAHVCTLADGVHVSGINIDPVQIASARANAKRRGLEEHLDFTRGDYNDPLPYPDQSFDCAYNVQAVTYVRDGQYEKLFREINRVLKPGARFSTIDWALGPGYDPKNAEHRDMLQKTKSLIGAVHTPTTQEYLDALRKAGFEIVWEGIPSPNGVQYPLILNACIYFQLFEKIVRLLAFLHIVPRHFVPLLERFNKDGEICVEGDKRHMFTMIYQVIARKPLSN
eukprot:m51a1_g10637 putative S-adenosyl-methionine-sterol-C-methyltransferase (390) ;mRNA; r:77727-79309